jgi:N-acetyl-gamma-glutamyl-phosphate reductase
MHPEDAPGIPDVAFFTLPHGVSHQYVPLYLKQGTRCIDFSADYRLGDERLYNKHYGVHTDPENLGKAVYGIPELFGDHIKDADLVANPGCYPTSVILGLAPFIAEGIAASEQIIVDAKSGVSGRGNKPSPGSMYCECNENISAYKVGQHRHAPEMEMGLKLLGAQAPNVLFVPHLVPMDRGILSTIYCELSEEAETAHLIDIATEFYKGHDYINVLPEGMQPRTKDVAFTNRCDIGIVSIKTKCIITSAIDNLGRGAATQAVQNMNVMFDLPAGTALE